MNQSDALCESFPSPNAPVEPAIGPEPTAAPPWWRFVVPIGLLLAIAVVYMPALDADFVYWDDDDLIFATSQYRSFGGDALAWMFTTSYTGHFQPLTWLSYCLDWNVWGREAFGFHLTNVLWHAAAALMFYFLTRRLLAIAGRRPGDVHAAPIVMAAAFATLLFAVHPLRAESVAWVAERRDVLGGFLYVACVACYVRYAGATNRRRAWYVATTVVCGLSLLAKASAMTVPLVLLILDVYPLRRWRARAGDGKPETADAAVTTGRLVVEKIPLFALAIAAGVRALVAQADGGALYGLSEHGVARRLAQAAHGLVFYAWKTVLPTGLGPLYQIPDDATLFGPRLWISVLVLAVAVAAIWRLRRVCPGLAAAATAYIVVLAPVLGIAQSGPQLVADRYSYLSCMGLAMLAGGGALLLIRRLSANHTPHGRALVGLLLAGLPVLYAKAAYAQNEIWDSGFTLWRRGILVSPRSSVAHTNLADALANNGSEQFPMAMEHYRQAIELDPNDFIALHHLAGLQQRTGDIGGAVRNYLRSLALNPDQLDACFSFGRLLVDVGRPAQALVVLRDGARRHPEARGLIGYLAELLSTHPDATVRNAGEAVDWAMKLNRLDDFQDPVSLMTLASAYADAGRFEEAVEAIEQAQALVDDTAGDPLCAELRRRHALFREGKPYHLED